MFCVLPWDSWLGGVIEHLCDCFGGIGSRTQILLVDKIIQELFYSHLENLNAAVFLYLYILGYGGSSRCVYSNPCLRTAPQECPIPSPDAAPVQTRHPATFPFIVLISWEVRRSQTPRLVPLDCPCGAGPPGSLQSPLVLFLSTEEPFGLQGLTDIYVLSPLD